MLEALLTVVQVSVCFLLAKVTDSMIGSCTPTPVSLILFPRLPPPYKPQANDALPPGASVRLRQDAGLGDSLNTVYSTVIGLINSVEELLLHPGLYFQRKANWILRMSCGEPRPPLPLLLPQQTNKPTNKSPGYVPSVCQHPGFSSQTLHVPWRKNNSKGRGLTNSMNMLFCL